MHIKKTYLGLLLISIVVVLFLNTRFIDHIKPNENISKAYTDGVKTLELNLKEIRTSAESFTGTHTQLEALQSLYVKARFAYKRIECFSAYLDYYSTGMLNGPNLPKIEYEQSEPFTFNQPTGFQVLEEVLYTEEMPTKDAILQALQGFDISMRTLKSQTLGFTFTDEMIFDAFRHQILRILALSLTGFDSPVSLNSIKETEVSIKALQKYYSLYQNEIAAKNPLKFKEVNTLFNNAQKFLSTAPSFNKLDRVRFTKSYLDPLFRSFQETAKIVGITPIDHAFANQTPLYSQAKSLFAADLIKPYFFHPKQIAKPREGMVELGKLLFFDPILSANNKRSCASCHNPKKAFTDGNVSSIAFESAGKLKRNTPTLLNVSLQQKFQLDARAFHMEDQFAHVMFSTDEMGSNATLIQNKLNASSEYQTLFKQAFQLSPKDQITHELAFSAIASYLRTLNTFNTPFDKYMRGELPKIDEEVIKGFNLFMGKAKCGTCHFAPVFNGTVPPDYTNTESEVLGVTQTNDFKHPKLDPDEGRFIVAGIEEHKYSFKTPTIRNIALTAPYMHNGEFNTLEEVMDFYNQGGGAGMGLEVPHQTLPPDKLNLSKMEIKQVIKFMNALTDTSGTTSVPKKLPKFNDSKLNERKVGGEY